jgi:ankyrin repeat protein
LDHGAKVNDKDKDGITSLQLAKKNGNNAVVELLRQAGARD